MQLLSSNPKILSIKRASKVAHNQPRPFYFTVQPRPTAHSPELVSHIMKSRDQRSVLLSVHTHITQCEFNAHKLILSFNLPKYILKEN